MAEIFGTSDDEEDVDFPFSISSGLPGELSLQNTDTKKFGNSLLGNTDSEMFLTHTFHDTLSSMPPVPVSISQSLKEMDMQVDMKERSGSGAAVSNDRLKEEVSNGKGEELMETKTTTDENDEEQKAANTEIKATAGKIMHMSVKSLCESFYRVNSLFLLWGLVYKSFRVNFSFLQGVNL